MNAICTYITRQFDSHSILRNLTDLIAVQLSEWALATVNKSEKVQLTEKLLKLISSSEMVPAVPFKYLPLVLPYLDSWEIYCMLNDLWRFLKDNYHTNSVLPNGDSDGVQKFQVVKHYFERLRIIGSGKVPGPIYVKIFKSLNKEPVQC